MVHTFGLAAPIAGNMRIPRLLMSILTKNAVDRALAAVGAESTMETLCGYNPPINANLKMMSRNSCD